MSNTLKEFQALQEEILQRTFKPVYLLQGEETFFIDAVTELFADNIMNEGERSFNQFVFYGKDTDPQTIVTHCRRFPMMSEKMAVIVKEAQHIRAAESELLLQYINNPQPSTVLVYACRGSKIAGNTLLGKAFKRHGVFTSDKLYESETEQWIKTSTRQKNLRIDDDAARLLIQLLGTDLHKISNAIGQVALHCSDSKHITSTLIQEHIGIDRNYNVFEFQKALGFKQKTKALEIALNLGQNQKEQPLVLLLSNLYGYYLKLLQIKTLKSDQRSELPRILGTGSPYLMKEYDQAASKYSLKELEMCFEVLQEYDLKSKGVGVSGLDDTEILKEMTVRLLSLTSN